MITDCAGFGFWDLSDTEEFFTVGVVTIMRLLIPLSICLGIWLRYYGRSTSYTGLGLDEAPPISETPTFSWPWRMLYAFILTATFLIGLLTFKATQLIQPSIAALLS